MRVRTEELFYYKQCYVKYNNDLVDCQMFSDPNNLLFPSGWEIAKWTYFLLRKRIPHLIPILDYEVFFQFLYQKKE